MNTNSSITNSEWLSRASQQLSSQHIDSARLDGLLMLEHVLKQPRINLIARSDIRLTKANFVTLEHMLNRRLKGEPMAYIIGQKQFYGRNYFVNKSALIPRPESETIIELAKLIKLENKSAADIGCGCGCLGISLKLEIPALSVDLIDTSTKALGLAKKNAESLGAKVTLIKSDLLKHLIRPYGLLLVNLPYLPASADSENLRFEPKLALFSGRDGLDTYRSFWQQVYALNQQPPYILCESLETQHSVLTQLAKSSGYSLAKTSGLIQLFQII